MYVRDKEYGLAISHAISGEDWAGVGIIINRVLDEYIISGLSPPSPPFGTPQLTQCILAGPEDFIAYATQITPSLPSLHKSDDENPLLSQGIFLHRLTFLTRFSRFLKLKADLEWRDAGVDLVSMFRDDLCPKSWRAVLLYGAVDLLNQGTSNLSLPSPAPSSNN